MTTTRRLGRRTARWASLRSARSCPSCSELVTAFTQMTRAGRGARLACPCAHPQTSRSSVMAAAGQLDRAPDYDGTPDQFREQDASMDRPDAPDQVLTAERAHLDRSREYLRLMREQVLSLPALAGDPVSQQYLKRDLYRRAESLRDLPDAPLFFGRLDYASRGAAQHEAGDGEPAAAQPDGERFHIGRRHVHDPDGRPVVIDWRAPVSRPFYRASPADPMGLARRRRF